MSAERRSSALLPLLSLAKARGGAPAIDQLALLYRLAHAATAAGLWTVVVDTKHAPGHPLPIPQPILTPSEAAFSLEPPPGIALTSWLHHQITLLESTLYLHAGSNLLIDNAHDVLGFAYGAGAFVAFGQVGSGVFSATSADGKTWAGVQTDATGAAITGTADEARDGRRTLDVTPPPSRQGPPPICGEPAMPRLRPQTVRSASPALHAAACPGIEGE